MTEEGKATIVKDHHLYGGSSVKFWSNCHGWASLMSTHPEELPGPAARRGTALHTGVLEVKTAAEIEHRLTGKDVVLNYDNIEDWPPEGPELAEEFWELLWTNILEEFITGKTIHIEKKLMLFTELDAGGTADVAVLWYNDKGKLVAAVGDCKFGRVKIHASDEQLKFYLAALNKIVREKGKEIDEFISFVYQPESSEKFSTHSFTKSQIVRAEIKYEKAILESKKDKPSFKAGDWCEYCKVKGKCKAYTKYIDKQMELMVIKTENKIEFTPPDLLSDEIIAKVVLFGSKIEKQIESIRSEAFRRLVTGHKIEGLKLVQSGGRRSIKDTPDAIKTLIEAGVEPYKPVLINIKEATTLLKGTGEHKRKKKEIDAIMDKVCVKSEGKIRVTTADDPSPEVIITNPEDLLVGLDEDADSEIQTID